jgi:hypothetical protein
MNILGLSAFFHESACFRHLFCRTAYLRTS